MAHGGGSTLLRVLTLLGTFKGVHALAVSPVPAGVQLPTAAPAVSYPLHEEVAAGDPDGVELMLMTGYPVDTLNARSSTPLHIAAVKGHGPVASVLLQNGASVNAPNGIGNSPLHAAVEMGQVQVAQLLVEYGADPHMEGEDGMTPLRVAAKKGQGDMLTALLAGGCTMDADTTHDAFWAACELCETRPEDVPLSAQVPLLLHAVFDADMQQLLGRERNAVNVTCMQPASDGTGYEIIDDELRDLELSEGRACAGGECCTACSRVNLPTFITRSEIDAFLSELQYAIVPPLHQFSLQKCAFRDMRTALIFVRLVERMRRAIAHEYGLALSSILPLQAFVSCFIGEQDKQGGLHSDESTHKEFHYSCVAYLSTRGLDFEGGAFEWNDAPSVAGGERVITRLEPSAGSANIFSSGWENMHEVEPLESGTRFAMPAFFTTCPPEMPELAEVPADAEGIADVLWNTLLAPEETADFRNFMVKWHGLLAPGR